MGTHRIRIRRTPRGLWEVAFLWASGAVRKVWTGSWGEALQIARRPGADPVQAPTQNHLASGMPAEVREIVSLPSVTPGPSDWLARISVEERDGDEFINLPSSPKEWAN